MIQKVEITRVIVQDKNTKTGQAYVTKTGKPFWRVAIQTKQTGDAYYSTNAFAQDDRVMKLQVGDVVTVDLTEDNGFKNFTLPSKTDLLEQRVSALEAKVFPGIDNGTSVIQEPEVTLDDF